MRFTFRLLAAIAAVALSVGAANAAPITSFGGQYTTTSSFSSSAVTFTNGSITSTIPNGPPNLNGATLSNLGIGSLGPVNSVMGVANTGPGFLSTPSITVTIGSQTAVFNLTTPVNLVSPTPFVGATSFSTQVVLDSGTSPTVFPGIDLSLFTAGGGGGTMTFTAAGIFINTGTPGTFSNPGGTVMNGTFSLAANATLFPTPEPASIAVFGVLALGGLAAARRKFLAKRETV